MNSVDAIPAPWVVIAFLLMAGGFIWREWIATFVLSVFLSGWKKL